LNNLVFPYNNKQALQYTSVLQPLTRPGFLEF
jgi:hypothetical protein